MTEEETFRRLKKWSKQDLLDAAHKQDDEAGRHSRKRHELLELAGWTYNEYMNARYGIDVSNQIIVFK